MARRLEALVAATAVLALAGLAVVAGLRLPHPFELEWQEGGVLEHVLRLRAGEPVYAEPRLDFVAFPYPPGFALAGAAAVTLLGAGLPALRALSLGAALAACAALFVLARAGGSRRAGIVCAGAFAASYPFAGSWFDLARVDALFVALSLWAYVLLERRRGVGPALAAGGVFFLAGFVKQAAWPIGIALLPALAMRRRAEALALGAALVGPVLASTLALDRITDGWYRWYVFELLAGHPFVRSMWAGFWIESARVLAVPVLLVVAVSPRRAGVGALRGSFALALLGSSWVARAHEGGFANTLMPACAAASLVLAGAFHGARALPGGRRTAAALLALGHFALLAPAWNARLVPSADDRAAGEGLVAELAAVEGEVFVPYHPHLARRAGKRPGVHAMAVVDLLKSRERDVAGRFVAELRDALEARRWAVIVLDDRSWEEDLPELGASYRVERELFRGEPPERFVPVTGAPWRPRYWYVPRE